MSYLVIIFFSSILWLNSFGAILYRPTVLMHGIVASASDMNEVAVWLQSSLSEIYVVSIEIGNGVEDSFLWPLDKQVKHFCEQVNNNSQLQHGFNLLGFSQGSLIVRAAVERCSLPVYNLITLSGLHQGVFGIPYLLSIPEHFRHLISRFAYEKTIQDRLSPANCWRDPTDLDRYKVDCHFLPDINNERITRNETYRSNIIKLNAFVMTYSDIDEVVTPKESGWFLGYASKSLDIETWNTTRQYTEDLIGMRTLWEQGKVFRFVSHTRHQDTPHAPNRDFFMKMIFPFLNNTLDI